MEENGWQVERTVMGRFTLVKDRYNLSWWERRKLRRMARKFANLYCQIVDDREHMVSSMIGEMPRRTNTIIGEVFSTDVHELFTGGNQVWHVAIVPNYVPEDTLFGMFRDDQVRRFADEKHRHR